MSQSDLIGFFGVALLLLAFCLNSFGFLDGAARSYHALNALGAALACWASWLIGFMPFVVLEGIWTAVATAALVRKRREPFA